MAKTIGFSRNIKLRWLNKTVNFVLEGKSEEEIKQELNEYLSFEIKSKDNLRKTREILLNIWVYSKHAYPDTWANAINLIKQYPEDALCIHWCMMLLAYHILSDVAVLLSNLADYQDVITLAQIKSKMYDEWGERATVYHSLDKIIQTLKDIDIISSESPGKYTIVKHEVSRNEIVNYMILAMLKLENGLYCSVSELTHIKQLFAFDYEIDRNSLLSDDRVLISNFGGTQTISLRDVDIQ